MLPVYRMCHFVHECSSFPELSTIEQIANFIKPQYHLFEFKHVQVSDDIFFC